MPRLDLFLSSSIRLQIFLCNDRAIYHPPSPKFIARSRDFIDRNIRNSRAYTMITEINRQKLDRSLILPNRIRGRPILLLIPSISMNFRQSTRHAELIRCPCRSTCHSVSRRFALLLLNLQITFSPVLCSPLNLPFALDVRSSINVPIEY